MRHVELAAWDVLLLGLLAMVVGQSFVILFARRSGRRYFGTVLGDEVTRIVLGMAMICIGVSIRLAGWLPWQVMVIAHMDGPAGAWANHAWTWTAAGAIVAAAGLSILFWPLVQRHRKVSLALAILVGVGGLVLAVLA
jgi:hypothetical protein